MMNNEAGRSMIEMLGVLAIIGVLSVGGIAGYTQAMKKYKVNEAVNTISMAAVMCATGQSNAATNLSSKYVTITSCQTSGTTLGTVGYSLTSEASGLEASVQEALGASTSGSYKIPE